MNIPTDDIVDKLKVLFILDKMEIPLTQHSIIDIVTRDYWLKITYMDCIEIISQLKEMGFIYIVDATYENVNREEVRYAITYAGRECLSHFYQRIPVTLREGIVNFAKENRMTFKRNQEYVSEYIKNPEGSYRVTLRIKEPLVNSSLLEINLKAPNKATAISACNKWTKKAPNIFEFLYDNFIDNTEND